MNIEELYLKNYRSYKEEKIYFTDSVYSIVGKIEGSEKSNGSGKSSIVAAISSCLFGGFTEADIHNDEKIGEIGLGFSINGDRYEIKRRLERGKTQLVFINSKRYAVKAAQDYVAKILGANLDIFRSTAYFQQGDLDSFSKLTPKEAKDVVINILQLGIYNDYEKAVKDKISSANSDILSLQSKQESIEAMIENEKIEQKESKYTDEDLTTADAVLKDIDYKLNLFKELQNTKTELREAISCKLLDVSKKQAEIDAEKRGLQNRINKLEGLKDKFCPTCEHELNTEEITSIMESLKKELKTFDAPYKKITEELSSLNTYKTSVAAINFDVSALIQTQKEYVSKITEIKDELKRKEQDKTKLKTLEDSLAETKLQVGVLASIRDRYENLRTAFGRNGIQAYIIENVLPEVQTTANDILKSLDTPIRVTVDSQKDLKKGGKAETLDINVITEYGARPYSNYSGGEKTFIDFAIRMALSIILARRSNCQIQTLILDEVFGELDSVNKQIISKALRYIATRFNFKKILIISHADELKESCNNIIKVKFNGEYSTIMKESYNAAASRSE